MVERVTSSYTFASSASPISPRSRRWSARRSSWPPTSSPILGYAPITVVFTPPPPLLAASGGGPPPRRRGQPPRAIRSHRDARRARPGAPSAPGPVPPRGRCGRSDGHPRRLLDLVAGEEMAIPQTRRHPQKTDAVEVLHVHRVRMAALLGIVAAHEHEVLDAEGCCSENIGLKRDAVAVSP